MKIPRQRSAWHRNWFCSLLTVSNIIKQSLERWTVVRQTHKYFDIVCSNWFNHQANPCPSSRATPWPVLGAEAPVFWSVVTVVALSSLPEELARGASATWRRARRASWSVENKGKAKLWEASARSRRQPRAFWDFILKVWPLVLHDIGIWTFVRKMWNQQTTVNGFCILPSGEGFLVWDFDPLSALILRPPMLLVWPALPSMTVFVTNIQLHQCPRLKSDETPSQNHKNRIVATGPWLENLMKLFSSPSRSRVGERRWDWVGWQRFQRLKMNADPLSKSGLAGAEARQQVGWSFYAAVLIQCQLIWSSWDLQPWNPTSFFHFMWRAAKASNKKIR